MRGTEGVVDVDVGERGQLGGQPGVVLRLPWLVADVLEHQDVPGPEVLRECAHVVAHHGGGERHVGAGQLGQPVRGRTQRQLGLAVLRPSEVRDEDQARAAAAQLLDRRQGRPDPRVVGDLAIIQRHVEVDPDQNPPAVEVAQVPERLHSSLCTRSTTRFE